MAGAREHLPFPSVLLTLCISFLFLQVYIDAKKTIAEGRKLPQSQCIEYPQMQELKEVLEHLGFEASYEEKAYPRDLTQFGRFRVLIKDPKTGNPKVEGVSSSMWPARRSLFSLALPLLLVCAIRLLCPNPHLHTATGNPDATLLSHLCPFAAGRELLVKIGELIPNLKSRKEGKTAKPGVPGVALPGYAETLMPIPQPNAAPGAPGAAPGAPGASGSGSGSSKKKKGK